MTILEACRSLKLLENAMPFQSAWLMESKKGKRILLEKKGGKPKSALAPLVPYNAGKTELGDNSDWTRFSGSLNTPIGKVRVGKVVESHFDKKDGKDRRSRGGIAAFVRRTLKYPQEIWHNYGNYVFVAQYIINDKSELCVAAIVGRDRTKDRKNGKRKLTKETDELHLISYMKEWDEDIPAFYAVRRGRLEYRKGNGS